LSAHPLFIVNPAARGGACARRWREIESDLGSHFHHYEVRQTTHRGHATELARTALDEGAELLISVGGDGTHSEIAAAFFDGDENQYPLAKLGFLPIGTGGDLARGLGLSSDPKTALNALTHPARPFDVGHLSFTTATHQPAQRTFINIASGGLSGDVVAYSDRVPRWLGGFATFFVATMRSMLCYRPSRLEITIDGERVWSDVTLTFAVCNSSHFGGGMQIAPGAKPDDGLLEVVLIAGGALNALRLTGSIYSGEHLSRDFVHSWQGREVSVRSLGDRPVRLDVDGEQPGLLPATWRIIPGGLHVVY